MATVFKTFLNDDIKSTRTLLHEAIPITGSISSGTYSPAFPNAGNIKNYAHGMFQSVYDYPYLSSSANHIFDLTVGYSAQSGLSSSLNSQNAKKINIYNQMAAVLMGYDVSGNVIRFDADGDISVGSTTDKMNEVIFVNFARLLQKDEIKKGSFTLEVGGTVPWTGATNNLLTITDAGSATAYKINSAAGEFSILTCSAGGAFGGSNSKAGLLFYQAGVAVLTASIFQGGSSGSLDGGPGFGDAIFLAPATTIVGALTGTPISGCCDGFRHRLDDQAFNNTTELNSTIHFCRVNSSDYNYSSNPSYLLDSQIFVKNNQMDAPISYITTVGLYSADNELLAVAKLSEPLKKDPTNEMIVRVRLDY